MRNRLMWVFFVCWLFAGCSALESAKNSAVASYEACVADPVCFGEMQTGHTLSEAVSTSTLTAIPQTAPIAPMVGQMIGQGVSILIGFWLGRKKIKPQVTNV